MKMKQTGYPSIDKPWLKFYQNETILTDVPECTIYQNLYNHNKDYPNDIALMYFGKNITYAQLFAEVENAAKAFAAQGVKCGDNVALCVPATPETLYAILALNKLGANANMLNPTFTEQQLTDRINETDAELMVVVNELYSRVENVIPNLSSPCHTRRCFCSFGTADPLPGKCVSFQGQVTGKQGKCTHNLQKPPSSAVAGLSGFVLVGIFPKPLEHRIYSVATRFFRIVETIEASMAHFYTWSVPMYPVLVLLPAFDAGSFASLHFRTRILLALRGSYSVSFGSGFVLM